MDADPHTPRPMSESSLAARDHHGPGHGVNRDRENLLRAIKTHAPDVSPEDRSRITEALLVDGWTGPVGSSTGPRPGQVAPDVTAVASEALEEEPPVGSVVLDREGYPHHREERGWMSTDPAGPAHVPWSTVRDVCGPLTLLVPAAAPDAVPEGRWTYNPESHVDTTIDRVPGDLLDGLAQALAASRSMVDVAMAAARVIDGVDEQRSTRRAAKTADPLTGVPHTVIENLRTALNLNDGTEDALIVAAAEQVIARRATIDTPQEEQA